MLWKPVPGFHDYEVSEHGDVRRGTRNLKPERTVGNGRKRFALSKGGRIFRFKAAQLVALAFIGPSPFEGAEVCHDDSFFHNNHYSNLRWDTHDANMADVPQHKLRLKRQSAFPIKMTDQINASASAFLASAK